MWQQYLQEIVDGNTKTLARSISIIENEVTGYEELLKLLPLSATPVIGVTGPPGAGKSTLVDALIGELTSAGLRIGVICVDPSSPFNLGALLGDRIRMSNWYTHPAVFIRSLATRGSMGGLHPKILEIADLMKAGPFDYIIVETVGVGQSELEIAGLADITAVVLVPEAGDDIQSMKAGLMEIADIFIINKADRPGAELFAANLRKMLAPGFRHDMQDVPVLLVSATERQGIPELYASLKSTAATQHAKEKKSWLLAEKAFHIIQQRRVKNVDREKLKRDLVNKMNERDFNLYQFIDDNYTS